LDGLWVNARRAAGPASPRGVAAGRVERVAAARAASVGLERVDCPRGHGPGGRGLALRTSDRPPAAAPAQVEARKASCALCGRDVGVGAFAWRCEQCGDSGGDEYTLCVRCHDDASDFRPRRHLHRRARRGARGKTHNSEARRPGDPPGARGSPSERESVDPESVDPESADPDLADPEPRNGDPGPGPTDVCAATIPSSRRGDGPSPIARAWEPAPAAAPPLVSLPARPGDLAARCTAAPRRTGLVDGAVRRCYARRPPAREWSRAASHAEALGAAAEPAACALCCGDLFAHPSAVLTLGAAGRVGPADARRDNGRVCPHRFHVQCLQEMRRFCHQQAFEAGGRGPWTECEAPVDMKCPLCRARADGFARVPDVRVDPRAWFDLTVLLPRPDPNRLDRGRARRRSGPGGARLSASEVAGALSALLPLDADALARAIGRGAHEAAFASTLERIASRGEDPQAASGPAAPTGRPLPSRALSPRAVGASLWDRWLRPPGHVPGPDSDGDSDGSEEDARSGSEEDAEPGTLRNRARDRACVACATSRLPPASATDGGARTAVEHRAVQSLFDMFGGGGRGTAPSRPHVFPAAAAGSRAVDAASTAAGNGPLPSDAPPSDAPPSDAPPLDGSPPRDLRGPTQSGAEAEARRGRRLRRRARAREESRRRISRAAFLCPDGGLLVWLLAQLEVQHALQAARGPHAPTASAAPARIEDELLDADERDDRGWIVLR
jgi:hypothetical protein